MTPIKTRRRAAPELMTALVLTTAVSVLVRDRALALIDPEGAMRTLNLVVAATNLTGRLAALAPLHEALHDAPDDGARNARVRDGLLVAGILYGVVAVVGNLLVAHAASILNLTPETREFSDAALYARTQTLANMTTLVLDYAVVVLATLGRRRFPQTVLTVRLLSVPVTALVATNVTPALAARLDVLVGAGLVAYAVTNVRRWNYDGSPSRESLEWVAEYTLSGVFSAIAAAATIVATASVASAARARGVPDVLELVLAAVTAAVPGTAVVWSSTVQPESSPRATAKSALAGVLTTLVAFAWLGRVNPHASVPVLLVSVPVVVHAALTARLVAEGLTPLAAISAVVGPAGIAVAVTFVGERLALDPLRVLALSAGVGAVAAVLTDVVLAILARSYIAKNAVEHGTAQEGT